MARRHLLLLPIAAGAAIVAACAAFSADEEPSTPTPDGGDSTGDGGGETSTVVDGGQDAATSTTCVATPGHGPPSLDAGTKCGATIPDLASDPLNCGACGAACAMGLGCQSGICKSENVASSSPFPRLGAFAGSALFDTNDDLGGGGTPLAALERRPVANLSTSTFVTMHDGGIQALTSDALGTYVVGGDFRLTAVAGDGGVIYSNVVSQITSLLAAHNGVVAYVDSAQLIKAVAADGAALSLSIHQDGPTALAVDENAVFFVAGPAGGQVVLGRVTLAKGDITLVPATERLQTITVDGTFIYFYDGATGELRRIGKKLTSPTSEIIATWTSSFSTGSPFMAIDGEYLYAMLGSPFGNNVVVKVPKCGGVPRAIAPDPSVTLNTAGRLAFDSTYMYFTDTSGGIHRVLK